MALAPGVTLATTLALALAGVIAWQAASWDVDGPSPAASRPQAGTAPAPRAPAQHQAPGMAQASLARPLFAPDRRPHAPAAAATAAATETPLPRLTATFVWPGTRSAIFAGQPRPVVAEIGGRIAGFDVQAIEPGQVTLAGPGGVRIVRPSFDGNRPAVTAAAERPLAFQPPPGSQPIVPPPPIGPGSPVPGLDQAFALPGVSPGTSPGTSPPAPDASQGPSPFEQNPSPTGLDIIRNPALKRQ